MESLFKINDYVKVISNGYCYSTHERMRRHLGMTWPPKNPAVPANGEILRVANLSKNFGDTKQYLYYLTDKSGTKEILIGELGLAKVKPIIYEIY